MQAPVVMTRFESPVGLLVAAGTDEGVCMLEFEGRRADIAGIAERLSRPVVDAGEGRTLPGPVLQLLAELSEYFAGTLREFTVPLVTPGTDWEQSVWAKLRQIPYGQTCSYGDLAARLGKPGAARAVGLANGRNRIAIVIPCHRVINADGGLHGYGGGLERKRKLLELEGVGAGLFR
jgi:AraC family transcriptional regulator of adaptative response/methylated-DNA-[protein]-cysteine methyltransferase